MPAAASARASASPSDDDLLDQARTAKDGDKFAALCDHGAISAYDDDESRADAALCCLLAFWTNGDRERIERLFNRSALVREKWTDRPDYRERTIRGAIAKVAHNRDREARARLPQILIETNIQNVADQAEVALRERASGLIYQRSDALVHVTRDAPPRKESKILTRTPQAPRIVIMEPARLRELLSTTARFAERKGGQGTSQPRLKSVLPPKWLVETLLARQQWELPQLDGIVEAPFLRPDGTIVGAPGFDEATSTLLKRAAANYRGPPQTTPSTFASASPRQPRRWLRPEGFGTDALQSHSARAPSLGREVEMTAPLCSPQHSSL